MRQFLKNWTIDLSKIPDYKEFNSGGFKDIVNKDICNKIIEKNQFGESVMTRLQKYTNKSKMTIHKTYNIFNPVIWGDSWGKASSTSPN